MTRIIEDFLSKHRIFAVGLIILACFLSYHNTLKNAFLIDDYTFLVGKNTLADVSYLSLFKSGFQETFRPVGLSIIKAELHFFGTNVLGYQLFNIALFSLICILFFIIFNKIWNNRVVSLFTCLLYLVHPINNFLVNYKTSSNLMAFVVFMQLSTLCFMAAREDKNKINFVLSLIFYFLALLTHEISFILPVFLFLILRKDKENKSFLCSIVNILPFLIPFSIFLFIRLNFPGSKKIDAVFSLGIGFFQYLNTVANLIYWYLSKLFYPVGIIFTWDLRLADASFNFINLLLFFAAIIFVIYGLIRRQTNLIVFCLLFFIVGFIPVLFASFTYLKMIRTVAIEPHWFAFSSFGIFYLFIYLISKLDFVLDKKIIYSMLVVLIMALGLKTISYNKLWKDDKAYCSYWLTTNSLNGSAWHCLATSYTRANNKGIDVNLYEDCRQIALLGLSSHIRQNAKEAFAYYQLALKKNKSCAEGYYGLALLFNNLEDVQNADRALDWATRINPYYYEIFNVLDRVFDDKIEIDDYQKLIKEIGKVKK